MQNFSHVIHNKSSCLNRCEQSLFMQDQFEYGRLAVGEWLSMHEKDDSVRGSAKFFNDLTLIAINDPRQKLSFFNFISDTNNPRYC